MGGYKYQKTHDDLTAIEEDDDDAIYGDHHDLNFENNTIGVTYNGVINDDSDISDDEELQKRSSAKIQQDEDEYGDIKTDNEDVTGSEQQTSKSNDNDEEKDKEESMSTPCQRL